MANVRVKDLPNANTLADADELIIDSSSAGTRRISYSELKSEVAGDYVAAPSTYKVATLASDNKLDPSQVPDTLSQGLNFVGVANSSGDLTSTTQGDFYVIQTAFGSYAVGDQAVYDGSSYVKVTDGTKQIGEGGTGATTLSQAQINLEIGNIGTQPQDIPLCGMLNSGAWLDFDAFYSEGTWTGSIEFGGASAGQTYSENNCNYTVTGNVVHVQGIISLSAKGSSSGTARLAGLPFTSSSATSQAGLSINYGTGFTGLTSLPSALVSGSSTTALLSNWGASGITVLTEANFTDATSIRFSGTYQIA
ncbi:MAG: hypothetical protein ACO22U_10465 [bacterium]